jgi:hypothetical protein
MTEGNTCYRGGKPGVSDVFASALWSADYLLQLASLGYAGVNLHGGDAQMVANSLGGTLPGDELVLAAHGDPATHPHPYYTPIAHIGDKYLLEPVAYGMMFAGKFAGATMIPIAFDPGPVNATAYAAIPSEGSRPSGNERLIAIINKDETQELKLQLDLAGFPAQFLSSQTLAAPNLRSTTVTLGIDPAGPRVSQANTPERPIPPLTVPPASALLLLAGWIV